MTRIRRLPERDARALLFGARRDALLVMARVGKDRLVRWARSEAGRKQIARLRAQRDHEVAPATLYAWADTPPPKQRRRRGPEVAPTGR